jgi:predicted kinase
VRAKVGTLLLAQPQRDSADATRLQQEEAGYVVLAAALSRPQPMLIITHGLSGSGKSRGASWLLERIGAVRVRSDVERKRLAGLAALDRGGAGGAPGAGLYAQAASRQTYDRLASVARAALDGGFPVIVDAAFLQRLERDRFRRLAERLQVPFAIVSFDAPGPELRDRVAARVQSGHDASDAGLAVLEHQFRTAQPLQPDELEFAIAIDASAGAAAGGLEAAACLLAARAAPVPATR